MLNKDELIKNIKDNTIIKIIKDKIKEKPLYGVIAGVIIFIFLMLILASLFGDSDDSMNGSSFKARKGPLRISITEAGSIQARERIIVKNEVEGNTSIIYIVDEGTKVKKGDLLVELDSSNLVDQKIDQEIKVQNADASFVSARENFAVTKNQAQSDIDKAQLAYDFAVQDLDKYIKGEYPNQLKQSESKITISDEEYTRAKDKLEWSTKLYAEKYLSESELQADQLAEKQKKLSLELSEQDLTLLEDYTHKRKMAQLESDVKQAEMALERTTRKAKADIVQSEANLKAKEAEFNRQKDKLKKIETQIIKTKLYAPADGLALYATSQQSGGHRFGRSEEPLDEGSSIRERQELIHLPTTSGFNAEIGIYEASLDKIRPGLTVLITIEALPGERFRGKVVSVAPVPDAETSFMSPDLKIYDTLIEVENTENINLLKSGMSCLAEVIVEQHKEAIYVPVQAVIRVNGKPTLYMVDGNDLEPREVEIGLDNNQMIHIKKGLKEGEVVSLTPPLMQASVMEEGNTFIEGIPVAPATDPSINAHPESNEQRGQGNDQSSGFSGPMGGMSGMGGGMPSKEDMIKRMDQDGDGKIAKSEMRFGAERFDEMDKNGDGFIEADEFEIPSFGGGAQGRPGGDMGNRQMPSPEEMMQRMDQNGDGKIEKSEMPSFFSDRFEEMDKNGNGFLEAGEFEMPSFGGGRSRDFNGPPGGMQGGSFGGPPGGSR
ncbi:HlyD family efflux transporter periplasmic adaptor subunit [Thermodesulfobacteriota bacterium]